MKTSYQNPNNKKFFHTSKKFDIKDISSLKKKIHNINNENMNRKKNLDYLNKLNPLKKFLINEK